MDGEDVDAEKVGDLACGVGVAAILLGGGGGFMRVVALEVVIFPILCLEARGVAGRFAAVKEPGGDETKKGVFAAREGAHGCTAVDPAERERRRGRRGEGEMGGRVGRDYGRLGFGGFGGQLREGFESLSLLPV